MVIDSLTYLSSSTDEDEDTSRPEKVFQRQQQMALLGMDASTFTMVPKAARAPTSGTMNPVSQEELDEVKLLLEAQVKRSREGIFMESQRNQVSSRAAPVLIFF